MSGYKYPNQDEMLIGVVVGGDSEDPAPDKAGGFRVWIPSLYNPQKIKYEDLPFARMITQGTQEGVQQFNPPPERGTVVLLKKGGGPGHPGTGHLLVMGVMPNTIMKSMGVPGGKSLTNFFMDAVNHKTDKKAPPKTLKTSQRNGAEIREVEDNDMWSQSLTKGIPATATLWPMSGIALPAVKGVSTAIQHSTGILNGNLLSALPGVSMSLGKMFTMLNASGVLGQIKQNFSPELVEAFDSMSNLITQVEVTSSYGFATAGRVDPTTFLRNATNLLQSVQSVGDLVDNLNRLTTDESLFGTENLEPVKIKTVTPYGTASCTVDANGNVQATINIASISANANANIANANTANANTTVTRQRTQEDDEKDEFINNIKNFVGMMTSAEQAFSSSGLPLFGDSAKMMFDVYNRLNPGATGHMKSLIETVNTGQVAAKNIKPLTDLVFKGGKILSGSGFTK